MYKLIGFEPPHEMGFGHWGFSVALSGQFVREISEIKLPESNRIDEMCQSILKPIKMYERRPIVFHEDTILATNFNVFGNACGLDVDWDDLDDVLGGTSWDDLLQFHPHNVDTMAQAVGLLSLFQYWYGFADSMRSIQPIPKRKL